VEYPFISLLQTVVTDISKSLVPTLCVCVSLFTMKGGQKNSIQVLSFFII